MKPLDECRLYTFVDSAYLHGRSPVHVCHELCAGGSDLIQLRAKDWPKDKVAAVARELSPICRAAGVHFVVNDYPDVAREVGASLCHLGQEDFFDAGHEHASNVVGPNPSLGLGLSTHAPEQAARAVKAEPAYIAIGPIYATGTKPTARPVTLEYVRWAAANVSIPWFAIGGINLRTLPDVVAAGARRICVVSAILNAQDLAAECRKYLAALPPV
ncbi:MAG TPA: thiamine phosphate synthase [Methylomirabilota bacterium]|nr:thiamine phosphate synthase [Methylomirabilota bacterium]